MHHKTAGDGKNDCKMRNACAPADAMLVALAGGAGVLAGADGRRKRFRSW